MRCSKSNKGFTLIEITVTLIIIAIILSIAASGFNRMNSKANLKSTAQTLASDLRGIALSALNSEQYQLQSPLGWGAFIDGNNDLYTIFIDVDGDSMYTIDEKVKTIDLSRNIKLDAMYYNLEGYPTGSVYFEDATALPYFQGGAITTTVTITLRDSVTSETQDITINTLGAVSVE